MALFAGVPEFDENQCANCKVSGCIYPDHDEGFFVCRACGACCTDVVFIVAPFGGAEDQERVRVTLEGTDVDLSASKYHFVEFLSGEQKALCGRIQRFYEQSSIERMVENLGVRRDMQGICATFIASMDQALYKKHKKRYIYAIEFWAAVRSRNVDWMVSAGNTAKFQRELREMTRNHGVQAAGFYFPSSRELGLMYAKPWVARLRATFAFLTEAFSSKILLDFALVHSEDRYSDDERARLFRSKSPHIVASAALLYVIKAAMKQNDTRAAFGMQENDRIIQRDLASVSQCKQATFSELASVFEEVFNARRAQPPPEKRARIE